MQVPRIVDVSYTNQPPPISSLGEDSRNTHIHMYFNHFFLNSICVDILSYTQNYCMRMIEYIYIFYWYFLRY